MPFRFRPLHVAICFQLFFYWNWHRNRHTHGNVNGYGDAHFALDNDFAVAAAAAVLGVAGFGSLLFLLFLLLFDVDGDYVDDIRVFVFV